MKKLITSLVAIAIIVSPAIAAKNIEAGPRKGRILHLGGTSAEFFVEPDRTVSIAFYDTAKKPLAPTDQVVVATAEAPAGKMKLSFDKKGDLLVSTEPLPEGEHYNVVLQVKENADAKPKNFRIKLDLSTCKECSNPEYACTCDE